MNELEPHYSGLSPEEIPPIPRNPVHVVLDNIRSAFNVGSIFRTSDAGAVERIHLCGMTAHPPHKKLEKTALGAFDYVPWAYAERTTDVLRGLGESGVARIAVEVTGDAVPFQEFDWPRPVAIVFGNEVAGINDRVLGHCDGVVQIPMMGHKNSLNVATAFGVVLYDVLRRWSSI
ncbi:MAG TPA: RNA methyltransferase [Gammaproteobacteria bacterium]|jgi:tRNA G18 (ribose-2'-O)-methylase SpoU|nr:RNA methyltransferase [Gammaproteobacteria bacterium]